MNQAAVDTVPAADSRKASRASTRYLYVTVAGVLAAIVYLAFIRTYWAPVVARTVALHPAIHLHSTLFFLWTAFFLMQTVLPLRNRIATHRQAGLFGIALAAMMVFSGLLAAIVSLKAGLDTLPVIARTAAALSFGGMTLFSTFMVLAVAYVLKPALHKRYMVLATFSILQAAVARWIMLIPAIGQPLRILIGTVVVDLMILAVITVDSRAQGRVHRVYAFGGALILFVQWARIAMLETQGWMTFTRWLADL